MSIKVTLLNCGNHKGFKNVKFPIEVKASIYFDEDNNNFVSIYLKDLIDLGMKTRIKNIDHTWKIFPETCFSKEDYHKLYMHDLEAV